MRRFTSVLAALLFLVPLAAASTAPAALAQDKSGPGLSSGAAGAIRGVIRSQLDAFLKDDGAGAYRHASPMIQMMFPDPGRFMGMVRRAYRPVYRSRDVDFRRLGAVGSRIVQEVHLTGPDGVRYGAFYFMQRQTDGSWKINGVQLKRLPGAV